MKKVAIIPARGGSKRIPRKNIKYFLGKPIIAYSIETALKTGLFDEVMVSTEDKEIVEIAKHYGANVPFIRSKRNSDDHATTVDVLIEVLEQYENKGMLFDYGCCIYPTAPFVNAHLLKQSYSLLHDEQRDSVYPVLRFGFPIQRALKKKPDGTAVMFYPEYLTTRSQDLEPAYHDAGQFYWFKAQKVKEEKKILTDNTGIMVLSEIHAHDIDTLQDWEIAEFKYNFLSSKK